MDEAQTVHKKSNNVEESNKKAEEINEAGVLGLHRMWRLQQNLQEAAAHTDAVVELLTKTGDDDLVTSVRNMAVTLIVNINAAMRVLERKIKQELIVSVRLRRTDKD